MKVIAIGDAVIVHGMWIGKVIHKFVSITGDEVFDVELGAGRRVAALEEHIVVNLSASDRDDETKSHW